MVIANCSHYSSWDRISFQVSLVQFQLHVVHYLLQAIFGSSHCNFGRRERHAFLIDLINPCCWLTGKRDKRFVTYRHIVSGIHIHRALCAPVSSRHSTPTYFTTVWQHSGAAICLRAKLTSGFSSILESGAILRDPQARSGLTGLYLGQYTGTGRAYRCYSVMVAEPAKDWIPSWDGAASSLERYEEDVLISSIRLRRTRGPQWDHDYCHSSRQDLLSVRVASIY